MQGQTAAGFSWFRLFSFESPEQFCPRRGGRPPIGQAAQSEREACKGISAIGTYNEEREIEPLMKLEIIAATTFGLEAVAKREIEALGYKILRAEDGKITFIGDERAVARANLWLRTADRVQIKMAEFEALEFEDLFQQVKAIAWEEWIPPEGKFIINGSSVKSKLSSVPACQSVAEKAIVEKLRECYGIEHFEKSGALYDIKITLLKNRITVTLDTTGPGLHKRGYRQSSVEAPIKETLAAAMVLLSFWKKERILVDPCCGSGTIPIEAAMIGRSIAPGISRSFASEEWEAIPTSIWKEERKAAFAAIDQDCELKIFASDLDPKAVKAAQQNAEEAGVDDCIVFRCADIAVALPAVSSKNQDTGRDNRCTAAAALDAAKCGERENAHRTGGAGLRPLIPNHAEAAYLNEEGGVIVTNPPYGERIGDRESIDRIYKIYRRFFETHPTWSLFAITADKSMEAKAFGRPADRRRKLYNGRLEVCYYQFHGQKPPRK